MIERRFPWSRSFRQRAPDGGVDAGAPADRAIQSVSSTGVALAAGFTIVFGLWLLWGYQLGRSLQNIEQNVAGVHDAYVRGEQTLSKVRTNVLLGSIYLRDALIDSGSPRREYYRAEMTRLRAEVERSLSAYVPDVASAVERDHWARLQTELARLLGVQRDRVHRQRSRQPGAGSGPAAQSRRAAPRHHPRVLDQLAALQAVANQRRQCRSQRPLSAGPDHA